MSDKDQIHATCVAIGGKGILLLGASGVGKSDLALRLIDGGAVLVADDRTDIQRDGDTVIAAPPGEIAGMMEVRGVGIVRIDYVTGIPLRLVVELTSSDDVPRLPEERHKKFLGVPISFMTAFAPAPGTPAKVRLALSLNDERMVEPR